MGGKSDFKVDPTEQCFLCLQNIIIQNQQPTNSEIHPFSTYSIQHLSRYLKTDINEIFSKGDGNYPKVEDIFQHVKLCESCANLNAKFSGLYQQLEKIGIKVISCLKLIHGNMLGAKGLTNLGPLDAFRKRTMEKCLLKLTTIEPQFTSWESTGKDVHQDDSPEAGNVKMEPEERHLEMLEDDNTDQDVDKDGDELTKIVTPTPTTLSKSLEITHRKTRNRGATTDLKFKCSNCIKAFKYKTSLNNHKRQNTCGKNVELTALQVRRQHLQILHEDSDEVGSHQGVVNPDTGRVKCNQCSMEFEDDNSFQAHCKATHPKLRYGCELCKKEFKHRISYHVHYARDHLGVRFKCDKCEKTFTEQGRLRTHQKSCGLTRVSKELKHVCHICGKRFLKPYMLTNHVKAVHLQLREHVCDQCGKKFTNVNCLKQHVKVVHSNVREYVCDICGKKFGKKFNVQFHKRTVHRELSK